MGIIRNIFCSLVVLFVSYSFGSLHALPSDSPASASFVPAVDYPASTPLKTSPMRVVSSDTAGFQERPAGSGIFYRISPDSDLNSDQLGKMLQTPEIQYVILDDRSDYNSRGDKTIRKNITFMIQWYEKAKETMGEDNIHKLVWLPKKKVLDSLMEGMAFVSEVWLLKMYSYYNSHHLDKMTPIK
jgi:hypothetical protein